MNNSPQGKGLVQLYSWKNDLPGQQDAEGRKEILDLPVSLLSKWRVRPRLFTGPSE